MKRASETVKRPRPENGSVPVRKRIAAAIAVLWLGLAGQPAHGAACPENVSSLFMPTSVSSQLDLLYGLLPQAWQVHFGESLAVTHLPGRGGSYAASRLLDEPGEGCALAGMVLPSLFFLPLAPGSMYEEGDLTPVAVLASAPNALWVPEDSPFQSLAELVVHARSLADPQKLFTIAGTGRYTDQHLATLAFDRAAGVRTFYLPVLGSVEAVAAVRRGEAGACWAYALPPSAMPGMRALAVADERRSASLPGVPTFREVRADMISIGHFGLAVLSATDEDTLEELRVGLASLAGDESLRAAMTARGFLPLAIGAEELADFIREQRREAARSLEDYPLIPGYLKP